MTQNTKSGRKAARPFPIFSLETSLMVARGIQDRNVGKPMNRILLAEAIGRKAGSSDYRDLLSSSYRYGLTEGTEKATDISLTTLGQQITKPRSDEERAKAVREAAMRPEVLRRIYEHYNNGKLPTGEFFYNVLERTFDVPREHVEDLATRVLEDGKFASVVRDVSGAPHVLLDVVSPSTPGQSLPTAIPPEPEGQLQEALPAPAIQHKIAAVEAVFVAHGQNKKLLNQVKQIVDFGRFQAIVADERESTMIPVPEKVIGDMHRCQAGIIIVSADEKVKDETGEEIFKINENVLVEIGAATVLYKKKVILLWDRRIRVPSNLQGLYRCEFEGDSLDWDAGLKLQKALTEFREEIGSRPGAT